MRSNNDLWSLRSLRTLSILLIVVFLLGACSPAQTEAPEVPAEIEESAVSEEADHEPVTIKVMNFSQEQEEFYKEMASDFQNEYPWITVEFELLVEDQYYETVPLMFQSDQAPDIFWWGRSAGPFPVTDLLDQGWIRPLMPDDISDDEVAAYKARWPEGSFAEGVNMKDGVIYSFSREDSKLFKYGYMFTNNEVFAAAGLDPETDVPMTWNELYDVCETIVEETDVYCLSIPLNSANEFDRIWGSIGNSSITLTEGPLFDYKNGRYGIDDPRALKAFEYIQSLFAAGFVIPGVNEKTFSRQAFAEGDAAIYFDGAWMPSVWKSGMGYPDLDFSVGLMPYPDDSPKGAVPTQLAQGDQFISSQTEHPEEAWLFFEYLTRPEGFYAKEYVGRGFGQLAFTDNGKWATDPHVKKMAELSAAQPFVVNEPVPVLACPATAESQAMIEAEQFRPSWEWEAMVEAITTGADFAPTAKEIAEKKNAIFLETLEAEQASGLDISIECYTFPDWEYDQDYLTKPVK